MAVGIRSAHVFHFIILLQSSVFLKVDQCPGQIAVVIIKEGDCLLICHAALLPEQFNVFDCITCHCRFSFPVVSSDTCIIAYKLPLVLKNRQGLHENWIKDFIVFESVAVHHIFL